jgi:alpha-galactosidase
VASVHADTVWLTSLDLSKVHQGWGKPQIDKNIVEKPITIAGKTFAHGLGTHAAMKVIVRVNGATRFRAYVGLDDSALNQQGSLSFKVAADGKVLFETEVMRPGMAARQVDVDLTGKKLLVLSVIPGGSDIAFDHADWADAQFDVSGAPPTSCELTPSKPYILTPKPSPKPQINGPKVFGLRPGHPVLFTIPATGERPMKFSAEGLPSSLTVDENTGMIGGSITEPGTYPVTFVARNSKGTTKREFKFVVGETLALTPPMGWSTWYMAYTGISQEMIEEQADAMVSTGLINHGYSYVNIDDGWNRQPGSNDPSIGAPTRDASGNLLGNKRFMNIKGMCDHVHADGLKIGIYISPGPTTCAGFEGSLGHEEQDAKQFAAWGFDFLKYDWCSYTPKDDSLPELQKPYRLMGGILKRVGRDFIFNFCQYGMGDVWKWGRDVGGNYWRTTGDLGAPPDALWGSVSSIGFGQTAFAQYAGPGGWNDPDNILVGYIMEGKLQPTPLTADEQYTYVSLWSLVAAPLILGCDLTQMDPFTISLLSNDEVIAVDQDPAGKGGRRVAKDGELEVWVKDLEDGSKAVGLFNRSDFDSTVTARWSDVGVSGKCLVRDLWRQKNLGRFSDKFSAKVPWHGVVLVRVSQ